LPLIEEINFSHSFLKSILEEIIILFIFSRGSRSNGVFNNLFFSVGKGDLGLLKYFWEISGRVVLIFEGSFKDLEY
jgi:hypothetical protein